jgi:hypothetical protein
MITLQEVKQALINEKYFVLESDIETAFNAIDQSALYNTIRNELSVEEWDKISPINGTNAQTVLENISIPDGGSAYIIKKGGQALYFQYHKPHVEGHQQITDALKEGNVHADEIANSQVIQIVLEVIKEGLKPSKEGYEEATKKEAQDALVLELIQGGIL